MKNDEVDLNFVGKQALSTSSKSSHKKENKKKKRRKSRSRPYAVKNFLQRPKINAPANTTQFLCEDKEYYLLNQKQLASSVFQRTTSISETESYQSVGSSRSTSTRSSMTLSEQEIGDEKSYENVFWESNDHFVDQEFERLYDDVHLQTLCDQTSEELLSRCLKLESTVHNLFYKLQNEVFWRQKMEEMLRLLQANAKLERENCSLQKLQLSSNLNSQPDVG